MIKEQKVKIFVGEKEIYVDESSICNSLEIQLSDTDIDIFTVTFLVDKIFSPVELDINMDTRRLGIALEEVRLIGNE